MKTTKLYDYQKLLQYDAEGAALRMQDNAPDVLNFLAYALSKHEEEIKNRIGEDYECSKEINQKALYTMFYMAVAAGYGMALEK